MFDRHCSAATQSFGSLPRLQVQRVSLDGEHNAAESVGSTGRAMGRSFGWPLHLSWCPLELSSCANVRQSKTANGQAKSHTLPRQWPSTCCGQCVYFPALSWPVSSAVWLRDVVLQTASSVAICLVSAHWRLRLTDLCFIPWTFGGFRETGSQSVRETWKYIPSRSGFHGLAPLYMCKLLCPYGPTVSLTSCNKTTSNTPVLLICVWCLVHKTLEQHSCWNQPQLLPLKL